MKKLQSWEIMEQVPIDNKTKNMKKTMKKESKMENKVHKKQPLR
jgi:hypothetical protein